MKLMTPGSTKTAQIRGSLPIFRKVERKKSGDLQISWKSSCESKNSSMEDEMG
jgi:hypothetical protein